MIDTRFDLVPRPITDARLEKLVVLTFEAALLVVVGNAAAKLGDDVREGVAELAIRQTGQLDAGRLVPELGGRRIERVKDEVRDGSRVLGVHRVRLVLGHLLVDILRQLIERPVANQRIGKLLLNALAAFTVAVGAAFLVKLLAARIFSLNKDAETGEERRDERNRSQRASKGHLGEGPWHPFAWQVGRRRRTQAA